MTEETYKLQIESLRGALKDSELRATQAEALANLKLELCDTAAITEHIVNTIRGDGETLIASRLVAYHNVLVAVKESINALLLKNPSNEELLANLLEIQKSLTLTTKE